MEVVPIIINLVSGALGGNLAGSLMKKSSMGTLWNSIAGIAGGGLGGTVLAKIAPGLMSATEATAGSGLDIGSILSSVGSGGVGGGVVMVLIGIIKKVMAK